MVTVGPGEPPEDARCSLSFLPFVPLRELTDLLPGYFCASENAFGRKLLPFLRNDLAFVFRRVGVFFCKGEMPVVTLQYCCAAAAAWDFGTPEIQAARLAAFIASEDERPFERVVSGRRSNWASQVNHLRLTSNCE